MTEEQELFEIFAIDGKMPDAGEGQCYDEVSIPPPNPQDLHDYIHSERNVGNRFAKGPPKGSKNNVKKYWYKTPFEEGTCIGKSHLVDIGFPPSIQARQHRHYIGGTNSRNHKWKGYEYKTLT